MDTIVLLLFVVSALILAIACNLKLGMDDGPLTPEELKEREFIAMNSWFV